MAKSNVQKIISIWWMLIILKKAGSIALLKHCNTKKRYGLRYKDLCIILVYLQFSILTESKYCCCLVTKLCPTLLPPHGLQPSGSSIHEIPRQEYWSGLPFPSPGDFPDSGIEPMSLALQADSLLLSDLGIKILQRLKSFQYPKT